jgi:hypothetical protein
LQVQVEVEVKEFEFQKGGIMSQFFLELSVQGQASSRLSPFTSFPYMGITQQLVVTIWGKCY